MKVGEECQNRMCTKVGGERIVSIRCRRHKKRFNVPKSWLHTCEWLCPHCFEGLSAEDRKRYAPKGKERPEIREAEEGKPIKYPKRSILSVQSGSKLSFAEKLATIQSVKTEDDVKSAGSIQMECIHCGKSTMVSEVYYANEHLFCSDCVKKLNKAEKRRFEKFVRDTRPKQWESSQRKYSRFLLDQNRRVEGKTVLPQTEKQKTKSVKQSQVPCLSVSSKLKDLLPPYRMVCKKCGKTIPIHKTYLDETSHFLCPSCFFRMGGEKAKKFCEGFNDSDALVWRNGEQPPEGVPQEVVPVGTGFLPSYKEVPLSLIIPETSLNTDFIQRCTEEELKNAVAKGRVSKVRAKIEMRRRQRKQYFSSLPSVTPYKVM